MNRPTKRTAAGLGKRGAGAGPWKHPNPKPAAERTKLDPVLRDLARARAAAAGRPYPNLVDNMWAARMMKRR